jgi:hypothetical protein
MIEEGWQFQRFVRKSKEKMPLPVHFFDSIGLSADRAKKQFKRDMGALRRAMLIADKVRSKRKS